jgi:hypothetical protein
MLHCPNNLDALTQSQQCIALSCQWDQTCPPGWSALEACWPLSDIDQSTASLLLLEHARIIVLCWLCGLHAQLQACAAAALVACLRMIDFLTIGSFTIVLLPRFVLSAPNCPAQMLQLHSCCTSNLVTDSIGLNPHCAYGDSVYLWGQQVCCLFLSIFHCAF